MAQQIREVMTPNPVTMPGTASVHEATCAMRDQDIGDVIVILGFPYDDFSLWSCNFPEPIL